MILGAGCAPSTPSTSTSSGNNQLSTTPAEELTQTYTSTAYGFSLKYPEGTQVFENGPNDAEKDYEAKKMISGTISPLLNSFIVQRKSGEILMVVKVPNAEHFPVVSEDIDWNMRTCGNEGLGELSSPEQLTVGGKKTLKVVTTYPETGVQEVYHCINSSPTPLVLISSVPNQATVEKMLQSFTFTSTTTSSTTKK